jgi:hypothetical protein
MASKVRVPRSAIAFGGWRGLLEIDGDVLRVTGEDPANYLEVDCSHVKRCSFNSNNGLWAFRMKDGTKLYLQTAGLILWADRSPAGRAANDSINQLLAKHGVLRFPV